jgi:hypothetical protein
LRSHDAPLPLAPLLLAPLLLAPPPLVVPVEPPLHAASAPNVVTMPAVRITESFCMF